MCKVCKKMHFVWFPCEMDFSHHEYPNPTRVACDEGVIKRPVSLNHLINFMLLLNMRPCLDRSINPIDQINQSNSFTNNFSKKPYDPVCLVHWHLFELYRYVMGVCCIVFDIDGMLFEFVMNMWNSTNNISSRISWSQFLHFQLFREIL